MAKDFDTRHKQVPTSPLRQAQDAAPNSPQSLVDAVNSELEQPYYRDIGQAYGAFKKSLGLRSWPRQNDDAGWKAAKKGLLTYAREQILLDLAVVPGDE